jgi:branched-chain amino acid transport system substrate-binding protein
MAACGSSGSGSASGTSGDGPISVLALQALSGSLAPSGQVNVAGLKAAVSVINESGGVDGRKFKLTVEDDQGEATQALSLLHAQLNAGVKPDVLIDGTEDTEQLPLQPLISKDDILAIGSATGYLSVNSSVSENRTKFTTSPNLPVLATEMAVYLKAKGYHKVALIASNDAYGKLWASAYSDAVKSAGLTLTSTASFDDSALDVTPELQALQASKPDVLIGEAYGPTEGYILADREELGWTNTPFVGAVTFSVIDLTKLVSKAALKNVVVQAAAIVKYTSPSQMSPNDRAFFDALQKQGPITQPLSSYGYDYDAIMLVAAAIKKAGSADPLKVAQALENLGSVSGTVIQPTYFTLQSHFPAPVASAYNFLTPGPIVDGMIKSES